jgi:hypothetical protein
VQITDEQGCSRNRRCCVDDMFALKCVINIWRSKRRCLLRSCTLKKAYDIVVRLAMWEVLRSYGIGGNSLSTIPRKIRTDLPNKHHPRLSEMLHQQRATQTRRATQLPQHPRKGAPNSRPPKGRRPC